MTLDLSIIELPPPKLQFGGALSVSDPKVGLASAGPFDLHFGSARKVHLNIGIVGPQEMIDLVRAWLDRCMKPIPVTGDASLLRRAYPGFEQVFHSALITDDNWTVRLDGETRDELGEALAISDPFDRFERVLNVYSNALEGLAARDANRPDLVIMAISDDVYKKCHSVERKASAEEKKTAAAIRKAQARKQLDLFDLIQEVEQSDEDFLKRDLRHALKARALKFKLPIQIATRNLLEDTAKGQDPATRAWNFSVGAYYKAGGVPWRLPQDGPETCFVGITFHHFRTTKRHIVQSSLAQAFSSEGEGFAIRGEGVPAGPQQSRDVHLSEEQAYNLAENIVAEYTTRTGGTPVRVVVHKTSYFDDAELAGIRAALSDIPIVDLVTLVPSSFRLLRLGTYPPKVGTVCSVNNAKSFLFTSGFMPELGTYPGPHVPQPFEVRMQSDGSKIDAAQDLLNLTRMNWNTADIRGKWPVTLSFARRVGGILDEFGDATPRETSFRYFL
ncbi:hypothetical protein [Pelagibacterium sp.]|uniref:hypothetical protein n=1 Tax=Pelagibacterium sp. TaxID=1967288 RepID=UPI003BAD3540